MTLADLLVALALTGLVLAGTFTLLHQGQQLYASGSAQVESQQSARIALARMAAELRQAGLDPTGSGFAAVSIAEPARIAIHVDVNGDGVIAGNGETITWLLSRDVLRRNAGGGAQPIINGVRALELTYFDGAGRPTGVAADVRAIGIALTTEPDHASAGRSAMARMATTVRLRNR